MPETDYTIADLIHAYLREYLPSKAPSTQVQQTYLYRALLQELGPMLVREVTPAFLRQWRDSLLTRHKPGTARRYLETLSAALTVAVRDYEWLDEHPMRKVQLPPSSPGRVRFLNPNEQTALLDACQQSRSAHLYAIVVLALYTGCRKNEIRCLTWEQVDFERACLRFQTTKNGASKVVPVVGLALDVLRQQYATRRLQTPWVFPRLDGKQAVDIDTSWERVTQRAGLVNFHFHDLRHTAASYMALSGATLRDIAEVLGHKSISVSARYAHLTVGHTREVLEKMVNKFLQGGFQEP